jgi:hypothetical protein
MLDQTYGRCARTAALAVALSSAWLCAVSRAGATDIPIPVRIYLNQAGKTKFVSKGTFAPPADNPASAGAQLTFRSGAASESIALAAGRWSALGNPPGAKGFKYKDPSGTTCKNLLLKGTTIKGLCRATTVGAPSFDATSAPPLTIVLSVGTATRYFGECPNGGTQTGNPQAVTKLKDCRAPAACTALAVDTVGDVGHYASVALGSDGLPVISHYDDGNDDLMVTHCDDAQCQTRTTTVVADGFEGSHNAGAGSGDAGAQCQIAISGDGNPIIAYQEDGIMLRTAHCNEPACTTPPFVLEIDHPGGSNTGLENSITVLPDGRPLIAWGRFSTATPGLYASDCDTFSCNGSDARRLYPGTANRATAITIGGDGLGLIAFRDSGPDDLLVAHCDDVGCDSAAVQLLDNGTVGEGNAIATGTDGFGIISYRDFVSNELKVVHCTNAACSTFDGPYTLDSSGTVGAYTSIAIGDDGMPLIAYFDQTNEDLKLAHCNDAACSSGAFIRTLDSAGAVGFALDIATASGGRFYVAYRDATNSDLKLAVCAP